TLFLSQGVPMLVAGDEVGKTQGGNNNAYCQDNEISWIDWSNIDEELLAYTKEVIAIHNQHPVFHRKHWFKGEIIADVGVEDIVWFAPNGATMEDKNWRGKSAKSLGIFIHGKGILHRNSVGEEKSDYSFFLIFNASDRAKTYHFPPPEYASRWHRILDTNRSKRIEGESYDADAKIKITSRSSSVFISDKKP
ncbi:MAG TPA: hypothetical protein VJ894_06095, partial [Cryomorphaceae bacterium]|nr:hypothetical protein [Cryomorphaceae bacterium]